MNTAALIHKDVWRLAGPMILSNLTIPLLGLVDTAVMGHLPETYYIGAVAIGGLIFSFIFWGFGFLRMGTTGLTAQAYGQNDADETRAIVGRVLIIALVFSSIVLLLQAPIKLAALTILEASHEVEFYAGEYFSIRIWGTPATLINYGLIGWFIGMQRVSGPLYILLIINITNIVLDLLFVIGFGMDVAGVALASVIAEYLGLIVGLYLLHKTLKLYPGHWQYDLILSVDKIKHLMMLNKDIFIRTLCLIFSFSFFTAQGAKHGDLILATNAVLMNLQTFMAYGLDGFAHAAEALVGRAVGRKSRREFHAAIKTTTVWSLGVALLFVTAYGLFGNWIVNLITDIDSIREMAKLYLPWLIIAPILSVWSYLLDGIFIGATRSTEMRNTMLISTFLFFLPAWWLLQPLGNHGLWAALMVFMVARGITMGVSYQNFKHEYTIPSTLSKSG